MSVADYVHVLRKLLPSGKAWEFVTTPGSAPVWDQLLSALAQEPQRIEDDGYGLLNKVIPDSTATDLDFWEEIVGISDEELTDAERLARIRAILFGPPDVTQASLETQAQLLSGDSAVRVFNRAYPPAAAGVMNAGDSLASGAWDWTWLCEVGTNLLDSTPNDFEDWFGLISAANSAEQSPVTQSADAATATVPASTTQAFTTVSNTLDASDLRFSIWVYPVGPAPRTLRVSILKRDNTSSTPEDFELTPDVWHKLAYSAAIGEGATVPQVRITAVGGTQAVRLADARVRKLDVALQARIAAVFPIHTRGEFATQGEFAELLEASPLDVSF